MAEQFNRKVSRNIANSFTAIGGYTVGAGDQTTLIGLTIANTCGSLIKVDVSLNDGANHHYIVKDCEIAVGSTLVVVGGDQKIVMVTGDSIQVKTDNALNTCDVIASMLEITN